MNKEHTNDFLFLKENFVSLKDNEIRELLETKMQNGQLPPIQSETLMIYDKILTDFSYDILIKYIMDSKDLDDFCFNLITPNIINARLQNARQISLETRKEVGVVLTNKKCPKCGNNSFIHGTAQTSSGDEASTNIYTCDNCYYTERRR